MWVKSLLLFCYGVGELRAYSWALKFYPCIHIHIVCFRPGNTSDALRFLGYFFSPYLSDLILIDGRFQPFHTLLKVFDLL